MEWKERRKERETDEMDQVELMNFDPSQKRQCHYNEEAHEYDKHHARGGVQGQTS